MAKQPASPVNPPAPKPATADPDPLSLETALKEELAHIRPDVIPEPAAQLDAHFRTRISKDLKALCFSGGGIRSATFALGFLQGLAKASVLQRGRGQKGHLLGSFDYLSTVSGGGYIGGWLSALLYRIREKRSEKDSPTEKKVLPATPQDYVDLEEELAKEGPESRRVEFLRSYSNYLTPQKGLFSLDTWTLVAIYLRNTALMWLTLLPVLLAYLLVPRFHLALVREGLPECGAAALLALMASVMAGFALYQVGEAERERKQREDDRKAKNLPAVERRFRFRSSSGVFIGICWTLLVVCALFAACGYAAHAYLAAGVFLGMIAVIVCRWDQPSAGGTDGRLAFGWGLVLIQTAGILATIGWSWLHYKPEGMKNGVLRPESAEAWAVTHGGSIIGASVVLAAVCLTVSFFLADNLAKDRSWTRTWSNTIRALVLLVTGVAVAGLQCWLSLDALTKDFRLDLDVAMLYVCFSGPSILSAVLFGLTLYLGLTARIMTDDDREWFARLCGGLLQWIAFTTGVNAIVLYGPWLLSLDWGKLTGLSLGSIGAGAWALWKAHGSGTEARDGKAAGSIMGKLVPAAAFVFIVAILILLAAATSALIGRITEPSQACTLWWRHRDILEHAGFCRLICVALLLLFFGILGVFPHVNIFSLNALYRIRLIRAYLGAANPERKPHAATGFDKDDNLKMHALAGQKPFHIVNIALNLVHGTRLAWQDRKAQSFTVSPLHCGTHCDRRDDSAGGGGAILERGAYRPSDFYGAGTSRENKSSPGITLGTAVSISGAAANPNMGSYSSPTLAFLMTLFNIRLGMWLGNPYRPGGRVPPLVSRLPPPLGDPAWKRGGPRAGVCHLIAEALGFTNAESAYVQLSDGGHFENLGLYEAVLRRCRKIVVLDSGADRDYKFGELAGAVHKIRVDLGVEIPPFDLHVTAYGRDGKEALMHFAAVAFHYPESETEAATLVYVKPTITKGVPIDVMNYAKTHPDFPHETTVDQFFGEDQFEAYRRLGEHSAGEMLKNEDIRKAIQG